MDTMDITICCFRPQIITQQTESSAAAESAAVVRVSTHRDEFIYLSEYTSHTRYYIYQQTYPIYVKAF